MTHQQELIEAYLKGLRDEHDRIIALLEAEIGHAESDKCLECNSIRDIVALIKEEQK